MVLIINPRLKVDLSYGSVEFVALVTLTESLLAFLPNDITLFFFCGGVFSFSTSVVYKTFEI